MSAAARILSIFHFSTGLAENFLVDLLVDITLKISVLVFFFGESLRILDNRPNLTEKSFAPSPDKDATYANYTLPDCAGRMQIPRYYVQQVKINQRVKLSVVDDHLVIIPDSANN